jgi:hypothetical protein
VHSAAASRKEFNVCRWGMNFAAVSSSPFVVGFRFAIQKVGCVKANAVLSGL